MTRGPRILISAGETSGDRLGAGLARALIRRRPGIDLVGMGGPRMAEAGVRLIEDASNVAVVGIQEVLARLPAIRAAMRKLEDSLIRDRPDLLVPIDFPDFNLRLAARARRAGVEVVYFVSPQVWAWRRGRVRLIRRLVRRMLVLFPFEVDFYEKAGVPVSFVGHPIGEDGPVVATRDQFLARARLDPRREVVALMPGSRPSEVTSLLPVMLGAAGRIRHRRPSAQFLITLAPGLDRTPIDAAIAAAGLADCHVHSGDFPEILRVCSTGVVASGTASLEAAVGGLPIVVVYRVNPLTYLIGRTLVRLKDIALPNLVAGRRIVPELIQRDCTEERIAEELLRYLEQPAEAERVRRELVGLRAKLGGPGVYDRAAEQILDELGRS